jgi:hypothetical protein
VSLRTQTCTTSTCPRLDAKRQVSPQARSFARCGYSHQPGGRQALTAPPHPAALCHVACPQRRRECVIADMPNQLAAFVSNGTSRQAVERVPRMTPYSLRLRALDCR